MKEEEKQAEKPNRMARRRNKTRQNLMNAAIELILEKGFDETTLDEIAETADVVQRTFYNHFDNKHECVMAALKQRFADYAEELTSATAAVKKDDPETAIAFVAMQVFEQIVNDPITQHLTQYPRMLTDAVFESQQTAFLEYFALGLEQKRFSIDLPIEVLEPIISWGFVGLILGTIEKEPSQDNKTAWAHFVLQTLGVELAEIEKAIATAASRLAN